MEKLQDKDRQFIIENIPFIEFFLNINNIYDEDLRQHIYEYVCKKAPLYDPNRGLPTTFLRRVIKTGLGLYCKYQNRQMRSKDVFTEISGDMLLGDDESYTLFNDKLAAESYEFEHVEDLVTVYAAIDKLKAGVGKSYTQRKLDIYLDKLLSGESFEAVGKRFGISKQRAANIYSQMHELMLSEVMRD